MTISRPTAPVSGCEKKMKKDVATLPTICNDGGVVRAETNSREGGKMNVTLGMTVRRIASDYTNGRIGRVIEIDSIRNRARVAWEGHPRTWVKFEFLAIVNG